MISRCCLLVLLILFGATTSVSGIQPSPWQAIAAASLTQVDDDVGRHFASGERFEGIGISEYRFRENGFDWHLIRFASTAKPDGPLWMVPHDDENAAFDAMIAAVREHGGVGIVVNSGPGSLRRQAGNGVCGVRPQNVSSCDPNRNFDARTPLFTDAFLSQQPAGQPIIALHTNTPGFWGDGHGGRGEITVLDRDAYRRGVTKAREGAIFGVNPAPTMANYDTLGLTTYLASDGNPNEAKAKCGQGVANSGVHFWHERVGKSDGSMSNYLALNYPDIGYFNAESRAEVDLAVAAARHAAMVTAYLANCVRSGDKPAP
jgi:hypothetical protein